ncbi:MAG: hypothetical protein H7202_08635 [Pedobacter sp.]|nr:hypothetical protein [Pedobacter sp.]
MELLNYLLKVSACSALFFAFYLLVLRKLTFFKINRFYLLLSLVISFIIPALQFTIERKMETSTEVVVSPTVSDSQIVNNVVLLSQIEVKSLQINATGDFNWLNVLPIAYGLVVCTLLLMAIRRLFQLFRQAKAYKTKVNGLMVISKNAGFTNCSFFNYVFIDENSLSEKELAVILAHEQVHSRQYHSVDKLIMIIAKAVLWFNPIIYLYDKALEQAHEYEADETTSLKVGTEQYAALLLQLAVSKSSNPLIHNFVKSPIKQRIKMLFNSKSKNMKKLCYLLILPMALGLVWLLATEVVYANIKNNLVNKTTNFQDIPFLECVKTKDAKGYSYDKITINSPGKSLRTSIGYSGKNKMTVNKLWFFINNKLYTEAEAQKFDGAFVKGLSANKGFGGATKYAISGVEQNYSNYVFWFGKEPKLSEYAARNKAIYQKYNGTTVSGTIVEYSYSHVNKALMDGFILKTNDGLLLKAFVEPKFVKQANAMVKKGDQVTIKIYNSAYWKDNAYPVLSSFKLMKGNKVLFDKWPKTAINRKYYGSSSVKVVWHTKEKSKNFEYSAQDSMITDKEMVYLYGKARLKTNDKEIFGEQIHYNSKTKKSFVFGPLDREGKKL